MNRRDLLTTLGAAAALPVSVRAQPPPLLIGFLSGASALPFTHLVATGNDRAALAAQAASGPSRAGSVWLAPSRPTCLSNNRHGLSW